LKEQSSVVKKGQEVEFLVEKTAYEGKSLGYVDNKVCFITNTLPGDRVKARITVKKKAYFEAKVLEIVEPSPDRISTKCKHATVCGGCSWQHAPYDYQVKFKREHVQEHMSRIGGFSDLNVMPVIASDKDFYYRNKMEYSFGDRRWLSDDEISSDTEFNKDELALGLHIPARFDRILNLKECHLQDERSYQIMDAVRSFAIEQGFTPFNNVKKQGWLRHLTIRNSSKNDGWMVHIMTFYPDSASMKKIVTLLVGKFPFITTIVETVNSTWSPVDYNAPDIIHYGDGFITDRIGNYTFRIHPSTFFQTNTTQAERLFQTAIDFAEINSGTVYDLYCGVGTLSLFASSKADKVIGIELNPQSIKNAEQNARDNGVENTFFRTGDTRETFSQSLMDEFGKPDILLTDPPRAGMHGDVVQSLIELNIPKIVYVSCNSATMARDLALLNDQYEITHVQPVDMFPQTYHIETVARLQSRK
jgi:23S rRNA (uracil1939-C5)-methyltransferase